MASEAQLLSLLGTDDLLGFQQSVQQSNPYNIAGRSLASWQPDMSTWGAGAQGATSFGKAFLSGLMQNYASNNAANQLSSVVSTLPQLREDPYSVAVPQGVDPAAFNVLKGSAILKNEQAASILNEDRKKTVSSLLSNVLGEGVRNRKISVEDAVKIAASDDPLTTLGGLKSTGEPKSVVVENPGAISNDLPQLTNGRKSTAERIAELSNYFQSPDGGNQTPSQASISARQQVEGEIKANTKSFDEAKAAREYGQKLLDLSGTAQAGMSQAGQTGSKLASFYEKAVSTLAPWDTPEADSQVIGDTTLASIAPEIVKMSRSPGAVSDYETKLYLGAGPSTTHTPEANAMLVKKLEDIGKLNLDYADFLELYRDQNSGSTAGASKLWAKYRQDYPIFKKEGDNIELNTTRPSWQEYFSGKAPTQATSSLAEASAPQYIIKTAPNGQRYKVLVGQ